MRSSYLQWLAQVLLGMGLVFLSANVAWIFAADWWEVAAGCALVGIAGAALVAYAETKERPLRRLRKARRSLSFPTQWAVKFGKRLSDGSEVALAVIRSDGLRFVIAISGEKLVSWGTPLDGSGHNPLVGANRKPLKPDPLAPLMRSAQVAEATPVLWLPEAKESLNLRGDENKLLIVMGNARDLKHALKSAEIAPMRRQPPKAPPSAERGANAAEPHARPDASPAAQRVAA